MVAVPVLVAFGLGACGNEQGTGSEEIGVVHSALDPCVPANPVVTEVKEETPGPVAPGISKIYFVTARNADSATCGPATVTFTPDSFHLFSIVAQPSSAGGVAPGATVQFRVTVTSDPSVAPGSTTIGFTIIKNAATSTTTVRGSLVYTTTFDNPTGCNRQRPAIAVDNRNPPPVGQGVPVTYHVTVRNVDNGQCGQDVFSLAPTPPPNRFETFTTDGPFTIFPQGSAVFTVTIQAVAVPPSSPLTQCFTVSGTHHATSDLTASDCVTYTTAPGQ
jgi:hypothetical protein